jgi:leader peptidase (prepilin peptidase) / N-methyltransferase
MSLITVVLVGVVGLFVGAIIWNIAQNQAAKLPLFGSLRSGGGGLAVMGWLPFGGFGTGRGAPPVGAYWTSLRPVFEIAFAAYWAFVAWQHSDQLNMLSALVFSIPLLIIFLVDAWTRLIHTNIIAIGVAAGWIFALPDGLRQLGSSVLAMVAAAVAFSALFALAFVIYRNLKVVPFGIGDIYLAAMIGAMVRLNQVGPALMFGIILAGVTLGLLLLTRRVGRRQAVPYGPFLVAGALIVIGI